MGYEPDLLVLDQPVASLDPMARRDFLRTILEIAQNANRTILFSTHITTDLERVADHVAVLRDGRIVFHDELDVLKESVKRLRITADHDLPAGFKVPGALHTEVDGCNALVAVSDANAERIAEIGRQWNAAIDVEDLSLEEIFLELHHE
jgi:ABC-2 type transport system ATP-binding protein